MKKAIFFTTLIITFCTAFTLLHEPEKDIIGQWRIDDSSLEKTTNAIIEFTRKSNPDMAAQMDERYEMVKDMIGGMSFEYKADHTYEIVTPQGPQKGKWSFLDENKFLLYTREGRPDRKDEVLEITASRLRLVNGERGDTTLFVRP
ncbi:MAG: hypothetical protein WAU23_12670 [Ferruginibacter sp.]